MKRLNILTLFTIYFMFVSFSSCRTVASSIITPFPNDDSWWVFKQFDAFRKSMDEFRRNFDRKFRMFLRPNETSLVETSGDSNGFERKFVENSVKCVNFTCKLCSQIEIQKYNISNRGIQEENIKFPKVAFFFKYF